MSTLSSLKSKTDLYLGAENIYNASAKTSALNSARNQLLLNYEISEFIVTQALVFATGVADIPTTKPYLRHIKFYTTADPTDVYTKLDENEFDQSIDHTWCIKDSSGTRKLHIYPTSVTTGTTLRYVYRPADMSDDGDDSGFNAYWDDAHACLAAWWLLSNDRQPTADAKLQFSNELIQSAMRHQDNDSMSTPELITWFDEYGMFNEDY